MSLIGLLSIMASCQNQQSTSEANHSTMDSGSMAHTTSPMSEKGSPLMISMGKMMENMHKMKNIGNADHDLAAQLQEHHRGAIDMAEAELQNGSDSELKKMAQKIKATQTKEIKDMDVLLNKYKNASKDYDPANGNEGLGKAMSENMMSMMSSPEEKQVPIDQEFAVMMRKHHSDGIKMGRTILQFAKDPAFKSMTEKMIADQTKEIKEFETWESAHK